MRARKIYDLDIDFYKKDVIQLKEGQTLHVIGDWGLEMKVRVGKTEENKSFDVKKIATIQDILPFSDAEAYRIGIEPEEWIHGYKVILRKDLFLKWVRETEENPNSEDVTNPFLGRGIQFGLPLDRIFICYDPTLL